MLPTPNLDCLSKADYESIYQPAEDTFALLDALEADQALLRQASPLLVVEIGVGSGCVLSFVGGSGLLSQPPPMMFGVDINPAACAAARRVASLNRTSIDTVHCSLLTAFRERLKGSVDLLLFNPPYVPTDDFELEQGRDQPGIYSTWAGGQDGMDITENVLRIAAVSLLDSL